jgi:hypothetical protein
MPAKTEEERRIAREILDVEMVHTFFDKHPNRNSRYRRIQAAMTLGALDSGRHDKWCVGYWMASLSESLSRSIGKNHTSWLRIPARNIVESFADVGIKGGRFKIELPKWRKGDRPCEFVFEFGDGSRELDLSDLRYRDHGHLDFYRNDVVAFARSKSPTEAYRRLLQGRKTVALLEKAWYRDQAIQIGAAFDHLWRRFLAFMSPFEATSTLVCLFRIAEEMRELNADNARYDIEGLEVDGVSYGDVRIFARMVPPFSLDKGNDTLSDATSRGNAIVGRAANGIAEGVPIEEMAEITKLSHTYDADGNLVEAAWSGSAKN